MYRGPLRSLLATYRFEILVILLLSALGLGLSVVLHAEMKPVARAVAYVGPVLFTTLMMALIAAMSLSKRYAWAARARRPLIAVAAGSVAVFVTIYKAELFYAPIAVARAESPAEIVDKIARNDNALRYQAWARILTMGIDEKNAVAMALVPVIVGPDGAARQSAALTLDHVLRRHTITTLVALGPHLRGYLEAKGAGLPPEVEGERAAEFTSRFVESGYKSVLKALEPKRRGNLPPGGVDALFLALATNEPIGMLFLRAFSEQGDEVLKPKAQETLQLVAFTPTT